MEIKESTADVGEESSPALKAFVNAVVTALQKHANLADGATQARVKQSRTTADALAKMCQCNARLIVCCSDAGRCHCPTAAHGGATDTHKFVDLEFFLDVAHGYEVSHSNAVVRERILKKYRTKISGDDCLRNLRIMFMHQDDFLTNWWGQLTAKTLVGLGQRCLFAVCGDMDSPCGGNAAGVRASVTWLQDHGRGRIEFHNLGAASERAD